jgi:hypothetical protein
MHTEKGSLSPEGKELGAGVGGEALSREGPHFPF